MIRFAILSDISPKELLIIAVALATLCKLYRAIRAWTEEWSHMAKHSKEFQGPPTLPILGNILIFCVPRHLLLKRLDTDIFKPYSKNLKLVRYWILKRLVVVVRSPEDIKVVLNSRETAGKGYIYRYMNPLLTPASFIVGSGDRCLLVRKTFLQTMKGDFMNNFAGAFDKCADELMSKLKPLADGRAFDIANNLLHCVVKATCGMIMGHDFDARRKEDFDFLEAIAPLYRILCERMNKPWLQPYCLYKLTSTHKRHLKLQTTVLDFMSKRVAAARKDLSSTQLRGDNSTDSVDKRKSILGQLIEMNDASPKLTDQELRVETFIYFAAAHDTMTIALSFACLMLGMHADVQEKARREAQEVLEGEKIDMKVLSRLKYTEMVVKEILRLFPMAPMFMRSVKGDLQLDGHTLPKGSDVAVFVYATQRSELLWRNADKFDPERFSPEECSKRHPYAYVPFNVGPRSCIGGAVGLLGVKLIIAKLLLSYRITTQMRYEDIELEMDISVRSMNGYKVSLEAISG